MTQTHTQELLARLAQYAEVSGQSLDSVLARVLNDLVEEETPPVSFDRAIAESHQLACVTDAAGQLLYVNPTMRRQLGFVANEMVGRPATDFIYPGDHARFRRLSEYSGEGLLRFPGPVTLRFETHQGDPIWLSWTTIHRSQEGHIYGSGTILSAVDDQTIQDVYHDDHTARILESIGDAFFAVDRGWHFTYINRQAERLLKRKREDLLGRSMWSVNPETVGNAFYKAYFKAVETNEAQHFEAYSTLMGTWLEVQAFPMFDGLTVYFRDIGHRKQSEDKRSQRFAELESVAAEHAQALSVAQLQLRQQAEQHQVLEHIHKRLTTILETTSDLVGICDRHNRLFYLNRAAREAFQVPADYPVTKLMSDQFISPSNSPEVLYRMADDLASKGIWQGDLTLHTFDGKGEIGVSQVVLVHEEGDETYVSMVARDISKRITTEIKLRDALQTEREVSELKSRLTTNISHEFRTPLASIQLSTDIMKRYEDRLTTERRMQHLDRIQEQVAHLTSIIDTVLHIDQIQTIGTRIQPEMIHTHHFVGEFIQEMGLLRQETHTFIIDFENDDCTMFADPNLLRQMVTNLVDNAIKFTPVGGEIRLSMALQGETCVLTLQDNGIGIPETDQPFIFHTFYRGRNATNIPGMVLIKQAVDAHNGQITFESVPNEYTTFTIRLPISRIND